MDLQKEIDTLFTRQCHSWHALQNAVGQLDRVETKKFRWGTEMEVHVQFNPARMISSAAKTDTQSIAQRPCFLCAANRPAAQEGIPFLEKYIILCNPYPILHNHLTIPLHSHVPQRIRKKIGDMLSLAAQLPNYVVFYNGPKCGASAPDHFHLQAGLKTSVLLQGDNELRTCLSIETDKREEAEALFEDVYHYLHSRHPQDDEPMLNVLAYTENNRYIINIFPRKAHRPVQYFAEGNRQLLISPGALDMAGLMIAAREEDFRKITQHDVEDIYAQVSMALI